RAGGHGHRRARQSGRRRPRHLLLPESWRRRRLPGRTPDGSCAYERLRDRRRSALHGQPRNGRLRRRGEGRRRGPCGLRARQPAGGRVTVSTWAALAPRRLRPGDLARVASIGLRTRRLRAGLSALGIAIGVAAIVAVLGLSRSSQAGLLSEIDKLGTNLLTVSTGQTLFGGTAELPVAAPGMIGRIGPVTQVADTGTTSANVYRSPLIPSVNP